VNPARHCFLDRDSDLLFESADLAADPGWKLLIHRRPASAAADALALLASWAATNEQPVDPVPGRVARQDS
jgi:hypothetical protein